MAHYRAVFFDWMLTLADYPSPREHVERAHQLLDRSVADDVIADIVQGLAGAAADADVVALLAHEDCSVEHHREASGLLYDRAGLDDELAAAMYRLLGDPSFHPVYPEVADVLDVIAVRGARVAVISDIHVDLRIHAERAGIGHRIDEWILSFEHGVQPDPAIFEIALEVVGVPATDVLMVGDRASHDGAAAALGIDTLILPARAGGLAARSNRLDAVVRLVGA